MKKRICLLLLVVLILLIPHAASANSAARDPWELRVYLEKVEEGTTVTILFAGADGVFREAESRTATGKSGQDVRFFFREGDERFCLVCVAPDGAETRSNDVGIVLYGKYVYDGGRNLLEDKTAYYNTKANCETGSAILSVILLIFFVPVAITFLVEWLTALCFKLRPVRYVFAINAITNPTLNLMLLIAAAMLSSARIAYWIVLAALEIAVVFIEYRYYVRKYADVRCAKLLLFSIAANVLSLAIGGLVQYFFL